MVALEEAVAVQALLEIHLQEEEQEAQGGQVCLVEIEDLALPLIFQMDILQEAGGGLVILARVAERGSARVPVALVAVEQGRNSLLLLMIHLAQQLPIQEAVAAAGMVFYLLHRITEVQGDQAWC